MFFRKPYYICILICLLFLSCSTFIDTTREPFDPFSSPYVASGYVVIDYSFKNEQPIALSGNLVFLPPGEEDRAFSLAKENNIVIFGRLNRNAAQFRHLIYFIPERRRPGNFPFTFNVFKDTFRWDGRFIFNGNYIEANKRIFSYSGHEDRSNRTIVLDRAYSNNTSMQFNRRHVSDLILVPHIPPYQFGKFIFGGYEFNFYAVVEKDYRVLDRNFTEADRARIKESRTVVSTIAEFFVQSDQRFQILNSSNIVVAELIGNTYIIYDSLPKQKWSNMKESIALLYSYRLIVRRLLRIRR